MKICPTCNQTYADDNTNFCLSDGATLMRDLDDAAPTVMLNQVRTTQPNFQNYESPGTWQNQPIQTNYNSPLQPNQSSYPAQFQTQNQTLPTVSLVLGTFGILLTCCYGGIPFGLAALITGYIGLKNSGENPQQYGGRGLAIAGLITGAVGLLFSFGIILIAVLAQIGK